MTTVIGYCRQSEARPGENVDTSLSLESQENKIREWAINNHFRDIRFFRDHDLKGENPNRPALRKAFAAVGKNDILAVYDLSRLARDNILQETLYREIHDKGGIVVSITEPNANDDLFRGIMGVINQQFRKQLGLRITAAKEAKTQRGEHTSRPPFGYQKINGELVPDEQWAPVVQEIFRRVAGHETFLSIARDMVSRYPDIPLRMDHRTINAIANRWTYSGGIPNKNGVVWCDGGPCHPPIVARELQERAIEAAAERSITRKRPGAYMSPLAGKVIHQCGARAYHRHLPTKDNFQCSFNSKIPNCGIRRTIIGESTLFRFLAELLRIDLESIPATTAAAVDFAEMNYQAALPDTELRRKQLEVAREQLVERKERAIRVHLDGLKDRDWMLEETKRIDDEIKDIDKELADLPKPIDPERIIEIAEAAHNHRDHINALTPEQSSELLGILGRIQYGPDGITIKYREPYCYLFPKPAVLNWPAKAKYPPPFARLDIP